MRKKKTFIPINTVDDLTGLVNHNFHVVDKRLNKLLRRNRVLTVLALTAVGCAICAEAGRREQDEQIYQLSVRMKKLEHYGGA